MRVKMNRAIAGYMLAGIVMLIILLYLRFPGDALIKYLKAQAAARIPGIMLSIDALRPSFPPGMAFSNVTIGFFDRPEATLQLDTLGVRPGWLSLVQGRATILIEAGGYDGEAKGRVVFSQPLSLQGPFTSEAVISDVRIEKCAWLRESLARRITGTLKASAAFRGSAGDLKNGTGTVAFTLTNGTYPLLENVLGFERIDFSRVDGKLSFRNGAISIAQLTLTGEKVRCSLKGNIVPAEEFRDSQIDLTLSFEMPIQGSKRMTMAIGGTIANPQTRFI